jgi:hypothetical protein
MSTIRKLLVVVVAAAVIAGCGDGGSGDDIFVLELWG